MVLIKYSNNYPVTWGSLFQNYKHMPNNNLSELKLFKFQSTLTVNINVDWKRDLEKVVLLKYSSNFWLTMEIPLINCEVIIF